MFLPEILAEVGYMKVYTYIRISADGSIIEEQSFDYEGPLALCGGGSSTINYASPGKEEQTLLNSIFSQLEGGAGARQLQEQFLPLLVEATGYMYDDTGQLVRMPIDQYLEKMDPVFKKQYENLQLIQEQTTKALKGEIGASPALENELDAQKRQLENTLSARLGPNWQETTAGIQAMSNFERNATSLREASRQEQLTQYASLVPQGIQDYITGTQLPISAATNLQNYTTGLVPTYLSAIQPYSAEREAQYKASLKKAEMEAQESAGIGKFIGTAGGAIIGGMVGGPAGATLGAQIGSTALSF